MECWFFLSMGNRGHMSGNKIENQGKVVPVFVPVKIG
jgi:hypothetical protein